MVSYTDILIPSLLSIQTENAKQCFLSLVISQWQTWSNRGIISGGKWEHLRENRAPVSLRPPNLIWTQKRLMAQGISATK